MSEKRLNDLAIWAIESDTLEAISFDTVCIVQERRHRKGVIVTLNAVIDFFL